MTLLVAPMFLDGADGNGDNRIARYIRFANWYWPLREELGFDGFLFIDNASAIENILVFEKAMTLSGIKYGIALFSQHLPRGKNLDYMVFWRALWYYRTLMATTFNGEAVTKLITIDSDAFVLSKRLANHIRDLNSGWETFWCPRWGFPEAAMHVLCQDAFQHFTQWTEQDFTTMNGKLYETTLPFTKVNKDFVMDRYGEYDEPQNETMDAYFQAKLSTTLRFS